MSVGRSNYLVICCQSGKCIFFPVHLEGPSLPSFPLFSLWGCFLFCTLGCFAVHAGKYWFSPKVRIYKESLCCPLCNVALPWCGNSTAQTHGSVVYWTLPKQNKPPSVSYLVLFFYWVDCCLFCYISISTCSSETLKDMISSRHTCPRC